MTDSNDNGFTRNCNNDKDYEGIDIECEADGRELMELCEKRKKIMKNKNSDNYGDKRNTGTKKQNKKRSTRQR